MLGEILELIKKYENYPEDEYKENIIMNTLTLEAGELMNYNILWDKFLKTRFIPVYYFKKFINKFDWENGSGYITARNLIYDNEIRSDIAKYANWNQYIYVEEIFEEEIEKNKDKINWNEVDPYKVPNSPILKKYKNLINWNRRSFKDIPT